MNQEAEPKLGDWLRRRRRSRGLTQRDLARAVGCSVSYIAAIEAHIRPPSPRTLVALGDILGPYPADLLRETRLEEWLQVLAYRKAEPVQDYHEQPAIQDPLKDMVRWVLGGVGGRGDWWEGSDVDLIIVWKPGNFNFPTTLRSKRGVMVNIHSLTSTDFQDLLTAPNERILAKRNHDLRIDDKLTQARILYDPYSFLREYQIRWDSVRWSPVLIQHLIGVRLHRVQSLRQRSLDGIWSRDWASALLHLRSGVYALSAALMLKCGRVIGSVRRAPELLEGYLYAASLPELYSSFVSMNGLNKSTEECMRLVRMGLDEVPSVAASILGRLFLKSLVSQATWAEGVFQRVGSFLLRQHFGPLRSSLLKGNYPHGALLYLRFWLNANLPFFSPMVLASIIERFRGGIQLRIDSPTVIRDFEGLRYSPPELYEYFVKIYGLEDVQESDVLEALRDFEIIAGALEKGVGPSVPHSG